MLTEAPSYSLSWEDGALVAVDQRQLPHVVRRLRITTVDDLIEAVRSLAIRGAPAIGVAGAFGVALAVRAHTNGTGPDLELVRRDAARIADARPTAVNLSWGVRRALDKAPGGYGTVVGEALAMLAEDAAVNRAAALHAADLVSGLCPDRPLRVLTHCNTGHLATAAFGTALGAIRVLAERGRIDHVLVGETRPLLQGARLTAWELRQAGIDHRLAVDSAAAWAMAEGRVDCVLVGADRIAANGDVANKIGTYSLAIAARRHRIPFVVVAPESTRDTRTESGADIVIEQRAREEVLGFMGTPAAPEETEVYNPAFDVTPAELVTAVVTERADSAVADSDLARRIIASTTARDPRPGAGVHDLAGLYADPALFADAVIAAAREFARGTDRVVAVGTRGLAFGTALAGELRVPLTLAADVVELGDGTITAGERVLLAGDVLATGATLAAAAGLVHDQGGAVAGVAVLVAVAGTGGRDRLAGHRLVALAEARA